METKKFTMLDEDFTCIVCNTPVKALGYTARDHCPNCLYSLHLDNYPGDRSNPCHGLLKPIDIEKDKKDSLKIVYKCTKCGLIKRNKMATDDNYEAILNIMQNKS